MTVSEALAILESATVECKKRDIDTPEVMEALDLLEPHIRPEWLIPQFRYHLDRDPSVEVDQEGSTTGASRDFHRHPKLSQRTNRKTNGCAGAKVRRDSRHESEGRD